jgi:hypothetical protein
MGVWDSPVYAEFFAVVHESIRGCLPMPEFASSGVTPDQETTVAVRPPPSPF